MQKRYIIAFAMLFTEGIALTSGEIYSSLN
jgi:hypothetical protein